MMLPTVSVSRFLAAALLLAVGLSAACASGGGLTQTPPPDVEPDVFLYERGTEALANRRWLTAREYFLRIVETYPTSRFRQDARLGIGDTYLGEGGVDSDILAAGEFREFLRFYPLHERADYAQYRLAQSQVEQMLSPQRDQTATRDALRELDVFMKTYPNSQYLPDVIKLHREARDRLSESEFLVGRHYYRTRWYPGAITRLEALLEADPGYTGRDGVYFYLAQAYAQMNRAADARAFYEKLLAEFAVSEYLEDAKEQLAELPDTPPADTTDAPAAGEGAGPAAGATR